ncbi:MAG TPA: hypothetical protein P5137_16315 [Candidatus Brocadiia bacterium]|nr:hypothetical protein [Candidatus Brocadiia bacterium]
MKRLASFLCLAALAAPLFAQAPRAIVKEGKDEVLYLDALASPKRWSPAECTLQISNDIKTGSRPVLHLHIPVDYEGGEKAHPIGWPRMYLSLDRSTESNWAEFERFEFEMYTKFSRSGLPSGVASLHIYCPDKPVVFYHQFTDKNTKLNEWQTLSIPTRDIKNVAEVAKLGFNIAEANYKHGDTLDFYFTGFRLVRSADFSVASFEIRNPAVFKGQPSLKVQVQVSGPPAEIRRGLPMTLRKGASVIRKETLPVKTGLQTLDVAIDELKLEPGDYTLTAFDGDAARAKSAAFKVVETPWEEK